MSDLRGIGGSAFRSVLERVGRSVSKVQERKPLPHDLLESEDAYLVVFDAPGVESSDVQVRYVDGAVEVRLDRFREFREQFEMRFPGRGLSLSGEASLPPDAAVDPQEATATLTDSGTLQVRIPREGGGTSVEVTESEEADESESAVDVSSGDEQAEE